MKKLENVVFLYFSQNLVEVSEIIYLFSIASMGTFLNIESSSLLVSEAFDPAQGFSLVNDDFSEVL